VVFKNFFGLREYTYLYFPQQLNGPTFLPTVGYSMTFLGFEFGWISSDCGAARTVAELAALVALDVLSTELLL